jgi:hypothetical protein
VDKGASAPNSHPLRKGRRKVADASTGLEAALALFGTHRCKPKNNADPQIAIGAAGGDILKI